MHGFKILTTLAFLSLFSIILGYSHYFLYFSLTRFIDLDGRENIYLAVTLGILALSFITTTICASFWDNRKTRYAYYLSAVWMGVLHYLTICFAAAWGVAFLLEKLDIYIPLGFLGAIGGMIAILTVIYGLSNARRMRVTRVNVSIKNLPASWEGKKIAHISDVHIGHILRSRFVRKIARKINAEKPEVVCITGDLFDGMDGKLEHLVDPLGTIEAPHGVLYVDGNHETYLGVERAFASLRDTRARILRDEIVSLDGLNFIGLDYPEPRVKKDLAKTILNLPDFDPKKPSVLLFHTPFQVDAIAKTGVDLELCGHTHRGQFWPFGYITHFIFKGRDYGLTTIGDFSLYTSSGIGTWGPPIRVGSKSEIALITLHAQS